MKKNTVRLLQLVSLLLVGGVLLSGCAVLEQVEGLFAKPTEAVEQPTSGTRATEPAPTVDLAAAYDALRSEMGKTQNVAVAYLGEFDVPPANLANALEEAMPEFCARYPFVLQVPEDRILGTNGQLFCIVTCDEEAGIAVSKSIDGAYDYSEGIAILDGGEAVLLFANSSGWGPDTLVNITDSTGTYDWYPLLNDYLCTAHMLDDEWNNRLLDISPYTEQLRNSYLQRLKDGWKVPTQEDLVGNTWSCKEWTNDGTEHNYEVTFSQDTAFVRWSSGYYDQVNEYPAAPYTLQRKGGFAVLTFDFGEFAGKQIYNILVDEAGGMLYTMSDVTGEPVQPGWNRLYRTLE